MVSFAFGSVFILVTLVLLVLGVPLILAIVAISLITRRGRSVPPPPVVSEVRLGLDKLEQRAHNLEEILLRSAPRAADR